MNRLAYKRQQLETVRESARRTMRRVLELKKLYKCESPRQLVKLRIDRRNGVTGCAYSMHVRGRTITGLNNLYIWWG